MNEEYLSPIDLCSIFSVSSSRFYWLKNNAKRKIKYKKSAQYIFYNVKDFLEEYTRSYKSSPAFRKRYSSIETINNNIKNFISTEKLDSEKRDIDLNTDSSSKIIKSIELSEPPFGSPSNSQKEKINTSIAQHPNKFESSSERVITLLNERASELKVQMKEERISQNKYIEKLELDYKLKEEGLNSKIDTLQKDKDSGALRSERLMFATSRYDLLLKSKTELLNKLSLFITTISDGKGVNISELKSLILSNITPETIKLNYDDSDVTITQDYSIGVDIIKNINQSDDNFDIARDNSELIRIKDKKMEELKDINHKRNLYLFIVIFLSLVLTLYYFISSL